jgi:uncharacterized protein YceK
MRLLCIAFALFILAGCDTVDAGKLKAKQQQHVKNANSQVKDQTGTDLGTVKAPKRKFGMPTAPVDP